MLYGYTTGEYFPLFVTYAVGSASSVVFLGIYWLGTRAEAKRRVTLWILGVLTFNLAMTIYLVVGLAVQQSHTQVARVIGIIAIVCGFALYASPFATIAHVLRSRSTESIPIGMVLVGTLSNAVWVLYGVLVQDQIILIPTIVNTCLCVLQLLLYVAFRPRSSRSFSLWKNMLGLPFDVETHDGQFHAALSPRIEQHEISLAPLGTPSAAVAYEELRSPTTITVTVSVGVRV